MLQCPVLLCIKVNKSVVVDEPSKASDLLSTSGLLFS
jgi:hypothetical protein